MEKMIPKPSENSKHRADSGCRKSCRRDVRESGAFSRLDICVACDYAMCRMDKRRLDVLLVERGLVPSRNTGQRLIMAGRVRVAGELAHKPGQSVPVDASVTVQQGKRFVSRGGLKLEKALDEFGLDVTGWIAADVGASTGGFTDCLLQRGAQQVFAIDVGYGQIAWTLRQDPRVILMERTNARYLETLPQRVDLVTVDASFISLKLLLPRASRWLREGGKLLPLIKPQFEAGRRLVRRGGVVSDPRVHHQVLLDLLNWIEDQGWGFMGLVPSPLRGPAGNVEFLALVEPGKPSLQDSASAVEHVLAQVAGRGAGS
jgi:23S rRNA (cytidine1920-2'-O)/16S rRNA (cytidine1409-2'-O)-methyltransferase